MPMTWNSEAEAKLLIGIIAQTKGTRLDYKELATYMGPDCSVSALHQHIFKLRRDAGIPPSSPEKSNGVQRSPASKSKTSPSMPKKPKRAASPGSPPSRAKKQVCTVDDEDNEEDVKVKVDAKPVIKEEV
ncbi:uncharacterized protein BDV14DRAFT_195614 [Aspergillus stella-maris]|uniref:uncharacterized protein n=1 Tax=Aspergillus stella-maris TaxID=1810926 RepID=UPI003CCD5974